MLLADIPPYRCLHVCAGLPVSSSLSLPAHHWEAVASANALVLLMLSPQEKRLISKFFEEISLDTGKYVFGVKVGGYDVHICCQFLSTWVYGAPLGASKRGHNHNFHKASVGFTFNQGVAMLTFLPKDVERFRHHHHHHHHVLLCRGERRTR